MTISAAFPRFSKHGFTLVELSIVLVIIGLIVGGIILGVQMISAAALRSQIAQIEKYNTAVNTFRLKYGYLPGDIPEPAASSFGFRPRSTQGGRGDGNGIIQGNNCASTITGHEEGGGETVMFWVDLSTANLIEGTFNAYTTWNCSATLTDSYYPRARLEDDYFIFVITDANVQYFHFGALYTGYGGGPGKLAGGNPRMTVAEAYDIDMKTDDGNPKTGKITAQYDWGGSFWWAYRGGNGNGGANPGGTNPAPTASTCFDNNSTSGAPMHYSMGYDSGQGKNCSLFIKFQ